MDNSLKRPQFSSDEGNVDPAVIAKGTSATMTAKVKVIVESENTANGKSQETLKTTNPASMTHVIGDKGDFANKTFDATQKTAIVSMHKGGSITEEKPIRKAQK